MMNSSSSFTVGGKIKYKIVLLGDQHVGKSSIIDRFINDKFEESYNVRYLVGLGYNWN
jgi:GTPase SAR1 family protein